MLSKQDFKFIVENTPLVTIDFICKDQDGKVLLGKRVNDPAKGYYFTPGGRIFKNESIKNAILRLSAKELGTPLQLEALKFNGFYDHLFENSIFGDLSLHCVNLAFGHQFSKLPELPDQEHEEYKFFTVEDILSRKDVHEYVRWYFRD